MKIKDTLSFVRYYEEEEDEGRDYWIFANLNDEELIEIIDEQKSKRNYDFLFLNQNKNISFRLCNFVTARPKQGPNLLIKRK